MVNYVKKTPENSIVNSKRSVTLTWVGGKLGELPRFTIMFLGVGRCVPLDRDVRPLRSIFRVDGEPLFQTGFCIRLDGFCGAFGFAYAAVDAFIGMNDQHVLALIEAVDGAHLNAVHIFALDAIFGDDVGHIGVFQSAFLVVS
jgi:hypothetical protein